MTHKQATATEHAQAALDKANDAVNQRKPPDEQLSAAYVLDRALTVYETIHGKQFTPKKDQ